MAFVTLSNIAGTKETMTLPMIIVGKKTVELTPKVTSLLNVTDKGRVIVILDDETNQLYIGKANNEKDGHAVSSGGKFQNEMVKSWLEGIANDKNQVILEEEGCVSYEGVTYYKINAYVAPVVEEVAEEVVAEVEEVVEERAVVAEVVEEENLGTVEEDSVSNGDDVDSEFPELD